MSYNTLSETKTLLNITEVTYDTQISLLNNVASKAIDTYIGRDIEETNSIDYIICQSSQRYYPINKPIIKVTKIQSPLDVITINSTQSKQVNIDEESLTIGSNVYTLADYSNVYELFVDVTQLETYISFTINEYTSITPAIDLIPTSTIIVNNSSLTLLGYSQLGWNINYNRNYISMYAGKYKISYVSGYKTIPDDLKYVQARVVQDMLDVQNKKIDPNIKSESITNYSYNRDTIDMRTIISNYSMILDQYKSALMFGSSDIVSFNDEMQFINNY